MARESSLSVEGYLDKAFRFLAEYSWIYDEKNVDIFVCASLEKIPIEWVECLKNLGIDDLHKIPFGFVKGEWPHRLKDFLEKAYDLGEFRSSWKYPDTLKFTANDIEVPTFIAKSTPAKKLQEIKFMAAITGHFALQYNCGVILDIGSGLGYLDQVLHHNFNLQTIGLESVKERSKQAISRIENGMCTKNMAHLNCRVENTKQCIDAINHVINGLNYSLHCECGVHRVQWDENSRKNVLLVGLHSCGNLMQDMMKLYCSLPQLKVFLAAGCCYHKIPLQEFPMSNCAKSVLHTHIDRWTPCVTGLRLGCQLTRLNWSDMTLEDHVQQEKCLFHRAAFQYFLQRENLEWKKPKRHLRKDVDMQSVESFASVALQNFTCPDSKKKEYREHFVKIAGERRQWLPHIRILDLLQILLQPIWEAAIMCDRIMYFKENAILANIYRMCNENISPRNLLLFGSKDDFT